MKNILYILLSILCLGACSEDKVKIEGAISGEDYSGKTMYLFFPNSESEFKVFEQLATTQIEENKFSFEIELNEDFAKEFPAVGYLTMFDMNAIDVERKDADDTPIATFILEKGDINVLLEGNSVSLSGTLRNNDFNEVHIAIKELVDFASDIESYASINDVPLDEEGRDGRAQFHVHNDKLRELTFQFVKENMSNHVGEFLFLRSYADNLFTPMQLKILIDESTDRFKDQADVKWLSQILDQIGDQDIDISGLLKDGED